MTTHPITTEAQRGAVIQALSMLNLEKPWVIEIKRKTKKRTLSQNALYHKWVGIFAVETGNDHDDMHEFFKAKWCPVKAIELAGETCEIRSTKKLNTQEMTAYMDKVYAFIVGEFGILLPLPEEQAA